MSIKLQALSKSFWNLKLIGYKYIGMKLFTEQHYSECSHHYTIYITLGRTAYNHIIQNQTFHDSKATHTKTQTQTQTLSLISYKCIMQSSMG